MLAPQSAFQQCHNWLAIYDRPPVACSSARVRFSSFCSVFFPSLCTILLLVFSYLIEFDFPAISHMSDTPLVLVNPRVSGSVTELCVTMDSRPPVPHWLRFPNSIARLLVIPCSAQRSRIKASLSFLYPPSAARRLRHKSASSEWEAASPGEVARFQAQSSLQ